MEIIKDLFVGSGTATTIFMLSLAAFVGILIGKLKLFNMKLGIAGVLFSGLLIGHFGVKIDPHVMHFVREFGLILFVYAIGIDVGPRFLSTFKNDGLRLNLIAISIVLLGFITAYVIYLSSDLTPEVITGIMSGAVTNTPGLGAAQEVLTDIGNPEAASVTGMGYAVAYPFGVIGIILTMIIIRVVFRIKVKSEIKSYNQSLENGKQKLESVEIRITNPNLFGKKISYIKKMVDKELAISRIMRDGENIVACETVELREGDILFGVSASYLIDNLKLKMGEVRVTDKKIVTGNLAMFNVLVTNQKVAGKTIEQIGIYRRYEANITRIFRSGMEILPTNTTTLELGDTIRIVGKRDLLPEIKNELGNSVKQLAHPNMIPLFVGVFLGIIVGSIPIFIPGLSAPAKLGLAGGPLLIAIILGHKGRMKNVNFYMTPGANMIIRELGIILFLACVGLSSGGEFVETLVNGGYKWMLYGALITFIPIFTIAAIARILKFNYLKICGVISGAMTDPPALEFANSLAPVQAQSTAYATVYPLTMFLRILLAQILILITL
ncbi:Aspartate/alanine antiporter [Salinivirga cyanobacteriivorans]|uniref:Aspartate/alanine antiporter n=1 Tax=Salinivirga cyanobacteriivorans TaxID=1307839 RepID=A0A0S2I4T3_9BACT|nr:putative transporter [Salinivirga cyanobacteriivorans]ALO17345.1 Aspartate/alanine antiporter [Salinivirga cyanobacteriivorans]